MKEKKLYQKPEIKEVNLIPEEAVLSVCKSNGTLRFSGRCQSVSACTNKSVGS